MNDHVRLAVGHSNRVIRHPDFVAAHVCGQKTVGTTARMVRCGGSTTGAISLDACGLIGGGCSSGNIGGCSLSPGSHCTPETMFTISMGLRLTTALRTWRS